MLTAEQKKLREGKLTASRVSALMSGEKQKLYDLWREVSGDPDYVAPDLNHIWPVRLGSHTEELNLDWFGEKRHCVVSRRGEVVLHPKYDWAAATLDGWHSLEGVCIETKHVGGRETLEKVLARYYPQFTWQMIVTETSYLYASIIEAANEPLVEKIEFDRPYAEELWRRAVDFMRCVDNLTPPVALEPIAAKIPAVNLYDMTSNNVWGDSAVTWLENIEASRKADTAAKMLKSLVPADAKICRGRGVEISRDRASRLSLKAA